jgi:hypothetical protein
VLVIVTRFIEYRPENIKIAFVPISTLDDSPPFSGWKVVAHLEIARGTKISSEEAFERLKSRAH